MKENLISVPCSQVYLDEETKEAVLNALDSGQYILGKQCGKFEKEFARYMGSEYAVLTNSATSALQLTLLAFGVAPGDEILTPSLTAFPTIEPIYHVGAKPVFIDIDENYLMDSEKIEEKITPRTRGIIPVHLYGNAVEMDRVKEIARKYNLFVLEDASQAHDAEFRGKKVGTIGDAGCFSFYPSKNMTFCGDGGIVITNDKNLMEKVKMLRNHGRKDRYTHELFGFNMRANEIQAAVGLVQLKHLPKFSEKRRQVAQWYNDLLKSSSVDLPESKKHVCHVYHLYVVRVDNRKKVMSYLQNKDICTGIHYPVPCHQQPAVTEAFGQTSLLPRTEAFCQKILSLPIFPAISEEQVHYVAKHFSEAVS